MSNRGLLPGMRADTWRYYTPKIKGAANGAATDPVLGTNGNAKGRYIVLPSGLVQAQFQIIVGTAGAAVGTGVHVVSLPVPARRSWDGQIVGQGMPYRAITGLSYEWAAPVSLADPFTSLLGRHDEYVQFYTPWTMLLGTGTIAGGATTGSFTHNLTYAPHPADITVTLSEAPGGAGNASRWPIRFTSITTTTATFSSWNGTTNLSTTDQAFGWKIRAEPLASVAGSNLLGRWFGRPFTSLSCMFFQVYYEPA